MTTSRVLTGGLGLLVLCLCVACFAGRSRSTVEELTLFGDVEPGALAQEGLAVVGVTSAVRELTPGERSLLAARLLDELRPVAGAGLVAAGTLALALPPGVHDELLDAYRDTGVLDDAELEALEEALPDEGYAVLARIESDYVDHVPYTKYVAPSLPYESPRGETAPELRTYRYVTVAATLYDLRAGAVVWRGSVRQRSWSSKQAEAANVAQSLSASFKPEYVDAPSLVEVTRQAFARLARELD